MLLQMFLEKKMLKTYICVNFKYGYIRLTQYSVCK
jgi:hypothetical protein